ncbi:NAD(P)H-hydrate dehydratase [Pseudooceanicola sp. 200-1SW]|uniref:NAD(P)H-hydrate dehydratase n=1 Tax=Pseudooceanicola sp. 200-1SW TaxID=3425949 RepID=UPI003D7F8BCA
MSNLLTGSQMRAVEGAAMAAEECRGLDLMERAGRVVVDEVFRFWPELYDAERPRAAILCGPGNNGGDGFVVARHLAARGWQVDLALLGDPARLSGDAAQMHAQWAERGAVLSLPDLLARVATRAPDLAVDALFGTGLARPLSGDLAAGLAQVLGAARRRVAVDILSGLDADSGRMLGGVDCGAVDLTVTFHTAKPGHVLGQGAALSPALVVADIGLDGACDAARAGGPLARLVTAPEVRQAAWKDPAGHKYGSGHALVLSGGPGRTGAARLAARAALRVGAGLVTLGVPPSAQMEVAAQITALMLTRLPDAEALANLLADDPRYNTLCLGPALGTDARARALVLAALEARRRVVLDADALSLFEGDPETLFAATRAQAVVLTPHGGEFARLFPDLAEALRAPAETGPATSKIDVTRAAAARAGCVVLLKGPDTVIAAPDGSVRVHAALRDRACPWLGTAGAGDVLSGLICGLLARGFAPLEAAAMAAWLHAEAARAFGPGLIAEDLPEALPQVLARLAAEAG